MSWIKDNKFVVALGAGTAAAAILIGFFGYKGASRYNQAKEEFDLAAEEASAYERLELYPREENLDGKRKALDEYREAVESLQKAFEPYRPQPEQIANISIQDFSNKLLDTNAEIRKACADAGTELPEAFFCGFEAYKDKLARGDATGVMNFELDAIRKLMLALAKSGAVELKNLYRPQLAEEDGREYKPQPHEVAREMPLEITFSGPERAVRAMVSDIAKMDGHYIVIRSMAVANAKKEPPRSTDVKFEKPAAPAGDPIFGGGAFVLPGEEEPPAPDAPAGDNKNPVAVPGANPVENKDDKPAAPDTSRILAQVLGTEDVQVFLRLDIMQFLPARKLP